MDRTIIKVDNYVIDLNQITYMQYFSNVDEDRHELIINLGIPCIMISRRLQDDIFEIRDKICKLLSGHEVIRIN